MPTLNWIGKEAVVNHHHHVPFHLLKDVPDLACGESGLRQPDLSLGDCEGHLNSGRI